MVYSSKKILMKKIIISIVLFLTAISTVGLAVPSTVNAAATMCVRSGCDLFYFGPRNGGPFIAPGYTHLSMQCWKVAQWYAGTNRWFKVNSIYGTHWVSAKQVINQTRVGRCS